MDSDFEKESKRKRRKVEGEPQPSRMESLPHDLILDIVSGLPVSSLVQFKSVCKGWSKLAGDPDLVSMHGTRMAENNPCLIFHCDYPLKNHLYFVELPACIEKKVKVKKLRVPFWSAMPEFDVVGSCNGLLCLSDSLFSDALYIYNPFTSNYQELPKSIQYLNEELVFGFGFHPTTKEYKVIRIVYYKNTDRGGNRRAYRLTNMKSDVQIFTLGCSNWRSKGQVSYHLLQSPSQVLVNGRLHWVTRPRRYSPRRSIISFDLAEEQFQEVLTPDCYTLNRRKYHLVVLGGCLSAVYCNYGRMEIWVMREYGVKESWNKKFSIGNYVPKGLEKEVNQSFKISKIICKGRPVRVLCILKNGEILLEYKSRALVSYDPISGKFKDLMYQAIPKWFQAVVHVGSLNWI